MPPTNAMHREYGYLGTAEMEAGLQELVKEFGKRSLKAMGPKWRRDGEELLLTRYERRIRAAREDPNAHAEMVMRDQSTDEPVRQSAMHRAWVCAFVDSPRVMIKAPKKSGKTTQAVNYILWFLGRHPEARIKIVCSTEEKAKKRIREIRQYIERSAELWFVSKLEESPVENDWSRFSITRPRPVK